MRDELFDRDYAAGRAELNDGIDRAFHKLARSVGQSLKALHHVEWSAPWKKQPRQA